MESPFAFSFTFPVIVVFDALYSAFSLLVVLDVRNGKNLRIHVSVNDLYGPDVTALLTDSKGGGRGGGGGGRGVNDSLMNISFIVALTFDDERICRDVN